MASRPLVQVHTVKDDKVAVSEQVTLPAVFTAPIRHDLVQYVHRRMHKNARQAYAVSRDAGHQTSAESRGTGRAVARIPRVSGGGTSRAGQGAFGNMCRKGRMFAPTKTWRKWHNRVNVNQKRYAVASALAASAVPALVMARGHRVEQVPEIPLVIANDAVDTLTKTKAAVALLTKLGAYADVIKAKDSKKVRAGKGKARNRRYVQRKGPLVIFNKKNVSKAFRNLPGVEATKVNRLNLLQLAPGGHVGRFVVWTKDALERLDAIFGTYFKKSFEKADYSLPRSFMALPDVSRIINSDEVQTVLRPKNTRSKYAPRKKNALKNLGLLVKLNPYAYQWKRQALSTSQKRANKKAELTEKARTGAAKPKPTAAQTKSKNAAKKAKKARSAFIHALTHEGKSSQ